MHTLLALVLAAAAVAPAPAAPAAAARNIETVAAAGPYFALTFDAHAESRGARELLALLRQRHVRATIFVTGQFARRHPDILRAAVADGHEIGNHTYSHPHLTSWASDRRHHTLPDVNRAFVQQQLRAAAALISAAIGRPPAPLWRAPFGEHNAEIRSWAAELGLQHVDWTRGGRTSLDALDWVNDPDADIYLDPEAMARRILTFEERSGVGLAGSIILMHLGSSRPAPPLLEALPIVLDETDRRGLRAVPVGELLQRRANALSSRR